MPSQAFSAAALAVACTAGLAGCAADRVVGVKSGAAAATLPAGPPPSCRFSVKAITDLRGHAGLGTLVNTRVDGAGFAQWFAEGVAAVPGNTAAPGTAPVELHIEVLKAYIQSLGTAKSANLVVKVSVTGEGAVPSAKTYRGVDASINWSNSESEVQAAFDAALASLRQQMSADAAGWCKAA